MPEFSYIAKDASGKTIKGAVEAPEKQQALQALREKGYFILRLEEVIKKKKTFSIGRLRKSAKISLEEMSLFLRQFATLINAGITVESGLDILQEQSDNLFFRKTLKSIKDMVTAGSSLSEAVARYPKVFPKILGSMIRAGESSGMLDEVLDRVAIFVEKSNSLQKKVKSALMYPATLIIIAFLIVLFMMIKVVPVFESIFSGFGAKLPGPTQFLVDVSHFLLTYFWIFIIGGFSISFYLRWYLSTTSGRFAFDSFKLKMPVFGVLIKKVAISNFVRTLGTLLKSGVLLLNALDIVSEVAGNVVMEKIIREVRDSIREGENITGPMEKSTLFPPMVTRMISVGEKTGELSAMLSKIADFYDEQVDTTISGLTSMIEPIVIVFLGIVIGGIVLCMFLPVFQLSQVISF